MQDLSHLEAVLARHHPFRLPGRHRLARAAVAAIFDQQPGGPCVLLIQRAQREGDPWSGHMALPGGRLSPGDAGAEHAARRETSEEIGLALRRADCLGRLSDRVTRAHSKPLPMVVSPFVYRYPETAGEWRFNFEVDAALWVPLAYLADPDNRAIQRWRIGPLRLRMPCVDYRGKRIWGLTLMMLDEVVKCLPDAGS